MTFVRDNGVEAVQSRVNLAQPQTLMSPYAHGMFASYLYQPQPRRVLIVGLGGGAMVRFLTHHEPQVQIDAVESIPLLLRSPTSTSTCARVEMSQCTPRMR